MALVHAQVELSKPRTLWVECINQYFDTITFSCWNICMYLHRAFAYLSLGSPQEGLAHKSRGFFRQKPLIPPPTQMLKWWEHFLSEESCQSQGIRAARSHKGRVIVPCLQVVGRMLPGSVPRKRFWGFTHPVPSQCPECLSSGHRPRGNLPLFMWDSFFIPPTTVSSSTDSQMVAYLTKKKDSKYKYVCLIYGTPTLWRASRHCSSLFSRVWCVVCTYWHV